MKSRLFDIINYAILILFCFSILYPLYYMLIISLSDGQAVLKGQVGIIPKGFTFETYKIILGNTDFLNSYKNTFVYTSLGTLIAVTLTAMCAYPLSRSKFHGRTLFTGMVIITIFFEGGIIPSYMVVQGMGFINTIWAIIIPPAISVWYMMIMRTFFTQIPNEMHESGYMDGANDLHIFIRIIIPLSIPVLATMVLFYAVWHWNSFFPAMLYLNEKIKYPVQIIMRNMVVQGELSSTHRAAAEATMNGATITGLNIKYAVIYTTIMPILLLYPFIQKYFVKGMMVGSLKD